MVWTGVDGRDLGLKVQDSYSLGITEESHD